MKMRKIIIIQHRSESDINEELEYLNDGVGQVEGDKNNVPLKNNDGIDELIDNLSLNSKNSNNKYE